jgi:DMSO/TMAO reductase YedYZ molybdopterin-dependent catalytic subunit
VVNGGFDAQGAAMGVDGVRFRFSRSGAAAGVAAGVLVVAVLAADLLPAGLVLAGALFERARVLLPHQVFGFLIVRLKFAAKPLGFWASQAAVVAACAVLGGAVGAWKTRRAMVPALAFGAVVAIDMGLIAGPPAAEYLAASLEAGGASDPVAQARTTLALSIAASGLLAAAAFGLVLGIMRRRGPVPRARSGILQRHPGDGSQVKRREILARWLLAVASGAGAGLLVQLLAASAARAGAAVQSLFQRIRGLPPEVTPNDRFYVVSKNAAGLDPRVDVSRWRLEITGLVGSPVRLTYDEIRAMPSVTRYHTLECISNEVGGDLIGNALWKGVRFRDLIQRAGGVGPRAIRFALRCADGYTEGIPVADAMQPDVMLAYEMNGETLPRAHGFPVRLLIPGLFGMKNVKWLTRIEATSAHFTGYWQASGWSDEAVVKTTSVFRVPDQARLPAGEVEMGGIAYSGDRGIQEVEVSTDGGRTWARAEIKKPLGPYTWVLWAAVWRPERPGEYVLKVRARDGTGLLQTAQEAPPLPDGASGHHTIRVRVRA